MWDYPQEKYFKRVKELLTQAPILLYYDPARPTVVSADVSSYGLRAALFQEIDSNFKNNSICITLNSAERIYAQIERVVNLYICI